MKLHTQDCVQPMERAVPAHYIPATFSCSLSPEYDSMELRMYQIPGEIVVQINDDATVHLSTAEIQRLADTLNTFLQRLHP